MDIGELLKSIRGSDSLRAASSKTGLSHNYIMLVERGIDSRGMPLKPSPETLKAYSNGYGYPYNELMNVIGYTSTDDTDVVYDIDPSLYRLIKNLEKLPQEKRELIELLVNALLQSG
ncbi:helix-turn-helix domain-containing protein [Paenibacillus ferrarius]|uniref:helix-turn-helix domain-containing protein n=1 Tax=Paenibacillus ferrarius TaxID=1469647 RepID=UPI00118029F9|nr:hypothetical protein [Paenibacillus ferrarius]